MKKNIYLHNDFAHLDEAAATAAFLLANNLELANVDIRRIPHQEAEKLSLKDKGSVFIDCGLQFDGVRLFDHHQDDSKIEGKAAFNLVVDSFASIKGLSKHKYYNRIAIQDNFGKVALFKEFDIPGRPEKFPFGMIENHLLKQMGRENDYLIIEILREVFKQFLIDSGKIKINTARFAKKATITKISGFNVFFWEDKFENKEDRMGLTQAAKNINADILVSVDIGGNENWRVQRIENQGVNVPVDFSIVKDEEDVFFAHKNGFMMVMKKDKDLLKTCLFKARTTQI